MHLFSRVRADDRCILPLLRIEKLHRVQPTFAPSLSHLIVLKEHGTQIVWSHCSNTLVEKELPGDVGCLHMIQPLAIFQIEVGILGLISKVFDIRTVPLAGE